MKADGQGRGSSLAKTEGSIIIDRLVEAVLSYVEDRASLPQYGPSIIEFKEVEQLPNGGARVTTPYTMVDVLLEVETGCTERVVNQRTACGTQGPVSSVLICTYQPQILFCDPADLSEVVAGSIAPLDVLPYATYSPTERVIGGECALLGAAAYDRERGLIYVVEQEAGLWGETVVHVWQVE